MKIIRSLLALFAFALVTAFALTAETSPAFAAPAKPAPAPSSPLQNAVALEQAVNSGKIPEAQFAKDIAELLAVPDTAPDAFFVRALAHAAAAQWVGHANNGATVQLPASAADGTDAPAWLKAYAAATYEEQIAYDWVRHLALEGKLFAPDALRNEVLLYFARARRMGQADLAAKLQDILLKMVDSGTDATACRAYWLSARRAMRPAVLAHAGLADDSPLLLYTRYGFHYKPNVCGVHTSWSYKPGGDILAVSLKTGEARPFLQERLGPGHVHGMDLWFDGDRVVFAYAPQPVWPPKFETVWPKPQRSNACFAHELRETMEPPHLYELSLADGAVAQLTDHNYWSDSEPVYLPSGGIVFSSDRSSHSPSCDSSNNDLTDLNLYSLTPDRKTVRRFLNHKDIDMHPRVLNDGRVAYLRWEYQERHFMEVHSVWTARPDGSGADALVKQHLPQPFGVRLASSLGATSQRLIAVATGHHALPQGPLLILDPAAGANAPDAVQVITQGMRVNEGGVPGRTVPEGGRIEAGGFYTDPFALNEQSFLASYAFNSPAARRYTYERGDVDSNGYGIYLVDVFGNKELLYRDPWKGAYSAFPLRPRRKPTAIAETADRAANHAVCTIANVYEGMDGVAPGTIRHIRISEALPWPIVPGEGVKRWVTGWTNEDKNATRWCPVRVIGTVPVEADGSAHFKVPVADSASVYFQALDENYMEIRRMRSSVSFAPGEVRSCTGCHETRPSVAATTTRATGRALTRAPSEPVAPAWGAKTPIHFPRDVQPILTKNCVSCHSGSMAKAGLDFSEGKAFRTIRDKKLVAISNAKMDGSITQVKQFGSHASRLTRAIREQKKMQVSLTPDEWLALVTWVDANTPYTAEMFHVRTADGRQKVWAPFEWADPWGFPKESPALGARIPKGLQ